MVQSPETPIEEEEGFNSTHSLQEESDKDDLIGEPFYLWRKPKFWGGGGGGKGGGGREVTNVLVGKPKGKNSPLGFQKQQQQQYGHMKAYPLNVKKQKD